MTIAPTNLESFSPRYSTSSSHKNFQILKFYLFFSLMNSLSILYHSSIHSTYSYRAINMLIRQFILFNKEDMVNYNIFLLPQVSKIYFSHTPIIGVVSFGPQIQQIYKDKSSTWQYLSPFDSHPKLSITDGNIPQNETILLSSTVSVFF